MAAPDRQAGATFGVEEEFFLIDPVDGCPVDRTEEVVAKAGGNVHGGHEDDIGETQYELAPTQVEFASGVCTDLRDLDGRLRDARRRLADAAVQTGARLIASGTPPLAGVVRHTTREARFERIGALYQGLALGYQASGCHVHVGLCSVTGRRGSPSATRRTLAPSSAPGSSDRPPTPVAAPGTAATPSKRPRWPSRRWTHSGRRSPIVTLCGSTLS